MHPGDGDLHAPRDSICWIMEGHNKGVSLCGHLIPIVMRNLCSHYAIMDRRRNLHHLQAAQHDHNKQQQACMSNPLPSVVTAAVPTRYTVQVRSCSARKRMTMDRSGCPLAVCKYSKMHSDCRERMADRVNVSVMTPSDLGAQSLGVSTKITLLVRGQGRHLLESFP